MTFIKAKALRQRETSLLLCRAPVGGYKTVKIANITAFDLIREGGVFSIKNAVYFKILLLCPNLGCLGVEVTGGVVTFVHWSFS